MEDPEPPASLEAELRKLCDQFPEFSPDEWASDQKWLENRVSRGFLDGVAVRKLYGKFVAVYQREVVLVGDDENAMRVELSKRFGVHPGRFVVLFLDPTSRVKKASALGCSVVEVVGILALVIVVGIVALSALGTKANETFSAIGSSVKVT